MIQHEELHNLISTLAAGDGTDGDWDALVSQAQSDAGIWRDLAIAQRQEGLLRRVMAEATDAADAIEAPLHLIDVHAAARRDAQLETVARSRFALPWRSSWSGWAVAALVSLAFITHFTAPTGSRITGGSGQMPRNEASLVPTSAYQSLQNYLKRGQEEGAVIGELPNVLVESRPAPGGQGVEVLYLRQILERALINDVYELNGRDETGQPTLARLRGSSGRTM